MTWVSVVAGVYHFSLFCFFFQAEDGIRDLVRSRGLGDVYKRQHTFRSVGNCNRSVNRPLPPDGAGRDQTAQHGIHSCLLYTSDAADDLLCVDLGGRRIIKKKNKLATLQRFVYYTT